MTRRTRLRIIYTVLLAVAAVLFVAAFLIHPEPTKPPRPKAVLAVYPAEGDRDIRQTTVFAELDPAFKGSLTIDGRLIPDDQVDTIQTGGNRISFTPGPGKEFTALRPGNNCAAVRFYPISEGETAVSSYSWCFNLN
jgi:hypothetical protein